MKTIIVFLFVALSASAQNFLIKFYPNNQPYTGLTNYPAQVQPVPFSTNVAGWSTNWTASQLESHKVALMPKYLAGESNAVYLAQQELNADIAQLVTAYSNLQWTADNFSATTNLANLRIAVRNCGDTLLKLKPVLVDLYNERRK